MNEDFDETILDNEVEFKRRFKEIERPTRPNTFIDKTPGGTFSMQITYRKLNPDEAPDFRRVRLECLKNFPENFGTRYEDEIGKAKLYFEEFIERNSSDVFFFGAFSGDDLVGIAGFVRENRIKTQHRGEIVSMYVNPGFHGQNIGENLLLALIKSAFEIEGIESIGLTVVADNPAAVRLYEKIGFETFGVRKNYFKSGDKYWDQRFMCLMKESFAGK
jgi:ribosomal protein S18 acetylase RimI-like enzyme